MTHHSSLHFNQCLPSDPPLTEDVPKQNDHSQAKASSEVPSTTDAADVLIYDHWDVDAALGSLLALPSIRGRRMAYQSDELSDQMGMATREDHSRGRDYLKMLEAGPFRKGVIADSTIIAAVEEVGRNNPQFGAYVETVLGKLAISKLTGSCVHIPPAILVGPPGVGKTHFGRQLATALGTPMKQITASSSQDLRGNFMGLNPYWKNARMGYVAKALIEGSSYSPMFIVDEADKARGEGGKPGLDFLHELLEPANSIAMTDEYVEVPIVATGIIWIFLANDIIEIPDSIKDRVLVYQIEPPTPDQQTVIVQSIAGDIARNFHLPRDHRVRPDVLEHLAAFTPRQARQILELSYSIAARRGTLDVQMKDVNAASSQISARDAIGAKVFLRPSDR